MKKAFEKFPNVDRLWCIAHRLHLIVTNALGFWLKTPVAGLDGDIDNSSDSEAIGNDTQSSAAEELIEEGDEGRVVNDDESEMVSASVSSVKYRLTGFPYFS